MTFSMINESGRSLIASDSAYLGFELMLFIPLCYISCTKALIDNSNSYFIGEINVADTYW